MLVPVCWVLISPTFWWIVAMGTQLDASCEKVTTKLPGENSSTDDTPLPWMSAPDAATTEPMLNAFGKLCDFALLGRDLFPSWVVGGDSVGPGHSESTGIEFALRERVFELGR